MNSFIVLNGKRLKTFLLIIFISLFTAIFFFSQSTANVSVFSIDHQPKAIFKGEKGIALTFNIGWGDVKAAEILNVLEKKNVRSATFFLSGAWAERHPDIVEKIVELGYEIGNLGYAYVDYTEVEDEKVRQDILKAQKIFKQLGIDNVELLRPPTGYFDKRVLKIANKLGYTVIHWSINSEDWKNPGVKSIVEKAVKAKNGDILLLHASDAAKQTAEALPAIIKELQKKGKLVNVSTLIASGDAKTTLIP